MTEPWDVPMTASFAYMQDADSCDDQPQTLTVEVDDAGGGPYLVLKTQRWAIDPDDIPRFVRMLRRALAGKAGMRKYFEEE